MRRPATDTLTTAQRAARVLDLARQRGALLYGDFTLSSGVKSSYYFDDRVLSLDPEALQEITAALLPLAHAAGARAVGGPTVAADPIVAGLVLRSASTDRPLKGFLVRSAAKAHGTGKQVEGPPLERGAPVAIVDGTASTGAALFTAIAAAERRGWVVVKVLTIMDRRQGGSDELRKRGYDYATLLEAAPDGEVVVAH